MTAEVNFDQRLIREEVWAESSPCKVQTSSCQKLVSGRKVKELRNDDLVNCVNDASIGPVSP